LQTVIKSASENINSNITLATIHSAKGLEYDYVYMIDNIEGEFPSEKRNMSDADYEKLLEEERRIFYVGMTRAKKSLSIIVPEKQSLFVNELLKCNKKINIL
jgi:DNA helicase-2/ATP-dependent DNA helicase PcrA